MTGDAESADLDLGSCCVKAAVVRQSHNAAAVDFAAFGFAEVQRKPAGHPMHIYHWELMRNVGMPGQTQGKWKGPKKMSDGSQAVGCEADLLYLYGTHWLRCVSVLSDAQ